MASRNLLDAFGDLGAALEGAADTVMLLPINAIEEDPDNPRRVFDDDELAGLAATIAERGVLQPITVRPAGPEGRYRLRFGARRLRAAQLAGVTEIRALVQAGERDEADALTEQLIENDQRMGLNTAELAHAVERLLALGLKQAEIGRRLGRTKDQIAMLASVRDMPPDLQALAPSLGVRTLYELNTAWKADPEQTHAWLSERDAIAITQAQARELAAEATGRMRTEAQPPGEAETAAKSTDVRAGREAERQRGPAKASARVAPPRSPIVLVTVRGRPGRLLLDAVDGPSEQARVRLDDGATIKAPLSQIRLVRFLPS